MLGHKPYPRGASRSVLLVASILTLLVSVGISEASAYYSLTMDSQATISSPEVILQNGTASTSTIYTNNTSAKVSVEAPLFDYVDNNEYDVDSSADKGINSNFLAQQAGPDSTYDMLKEENIEAIEDYVDNDVSDMDSSGDKGTLSDFDNMKTKDGMANLTEVAGGTLTDLQVPTTCMDQMWNQGQDYEWYSAWTPPGSGTVTVTKLWFWDDDGTVGTGETIYMAMYEGGGGYSKLSGSDTTLTGTGSQGWLSADVNTSFEITLGTTYWIGATCASGGTYNICRDDGANCGNYPPNGVGTYYQTNNYVLDSSVPTGASQSINKYIIPGITYTTGTGDYELDQEVQFTNVIDFLSTEKLCIYTGTLGDEDLRVDYWNGTGWENLATDLVAFSCNEYTVSLTSVNFTIRFKGGTESSDTTQDQWQIDASLLRVEGAGSREDGVDQQSNVDSSTDVGTHSDFNAMKTKDGYDNLTESTIEQQYTFFEDWESGSIASENWTTYSSVAQGRVVVDTSTPYEGSYALWMDVDTGGIYSLNELITNFDFSGATQVVLDFYHNEQGDENEAGSDHSGHQNADGVYYTLDGSYWYHLVNLVDPSGWTNVNINLTADPDFQGPVNSSFAIKFTQYDNYPRTNDGRGFENINITYTISGTDYTMDLEVQWIDLPYLLPNENISIYCGTMGTEDLKVDVWNGTGWETVFTDLSSGWNNASITDWLTISSFTIRFKGGNETVDPSQDTWQIDVALIHIWHEGEENYQLDLEVQWTNADYTRTNEELCVRTGSFSGSEKVQVRVWNNTGSSWHWVMNLTANQWKNVSITSYLISSTLTVQFLGGTETSDTTQDSWNIDATLLHVWTAESTYDYYDYVDNNSSNVGSPTDIGIHSNFTAQQYGPDSVYDTLTEDNTGDVSNLIFFEDWESGLIASENWTTYSSAAQGRVVVDTDTPYGGSYALWMDVDTGGIYSLNELITNFDFSGATQVVLDFYHNEQGDENEAGSDHTDHQNADGVYYTLDGSYWYHLVNLVDPSGWTNVNINLTADPDFQGPVNSSFAIKFTQYDNYPRTNDGRGFENINISYTTVGENYELDLEVQWTDAPYLLPNQELCIRTGATGTEEIKVDIWNGTEWINILTNLTPNNWNNVSVSSYLTSSDFTIRFKGGNETDDNTQDSWNIDVTLLHVWPVLEFTDYVDKDTSDVDSSADKGTHGNFTAQQYGPDSTYDTLVEEGVGGNPDLTVTTANTIVNNYTYTTENALSSASVITVNDVSEFSAGDIILIIQMQNGTGVGVAGVFEFNEIASIVSSNFTLESGLQNNYYTGTFDDDTNSSATQVIKVPIYNNVTIQSGASITCPAWNGYTGGIVVFNASGTITVTGSIDVDAKGFRGGAGVTESGAPEFAWAGESWNGKGGNRTSEDPNFGGGGGGDDDHVGPGVCGASGGGGGYGTAGSDGLDSYQGQPAGHGGLIYGIADIGTKIFLGSGGGGGGADDSGIDGGDGGAGGGLIIVTATTSITVTGSISADGEDGEAASDWAGAGGAGSGGAIWLRADTLTLGTNLVTAVGGTGGSQGQGSDGGDGGYGRIRLDYNSISGSTSPTAGYNSSPVTVSGGDELYELDLEIQWTDLPYMLPYEEICIYGGTMGGENITVDVWNGTVWKNLFTDLSSGWNNKSVSSYLTSSDFTIRFKGGNETDDNTQDSWNIDTSLLHVWTSNGEYDYVLRVNNTVTGSWQIRLKEYSSSNISRLQDCTIYFHNSTDGTSPQIVIENGILVNETGAWYDLDSLETIYVAMPAATNSIGTSYIYTYLEIRIPATSTYIRYIITFEII